MYGRALEFGAVPQDGRKLKEGFMYIGINEDTIYIQSDLSGSLP